MLKGISYALCEVSLLCYLDKTPSHGMSGYFIHCRVGCIRLQGRGGKVFPISPLEQTLPHSHPWGQKGDEKWQGDRHETSAHTNSTPCTMGPHQSCVFPSLCCCCEWEALSACQPPAQATVGCRSCAAAPSASAWVAGPEWESLSGRPCDPTWKCWQMHNEPFCLKKCRSLGKSPSLSVLRCFCLWNRNVLS